jgi:hypothetical protein
MTTWIEFAQQAPELAAFGKSRLDGRVSYLATVRSDGSPRVHPVTPIVGEELFVFMEPTSPKGKDLLRDRRFTLHCGVENSSGGGGEFYVRGHATFIDDAMLREQAVQAASYKPQDRYVLYALSVEFAFMNVYADGEPNVVRWQSS